MKKLPLKKILLLLSIVVLLPIHVSFSQLEGTAGIFSRLGFGARGMGMGNAMTAVIQNDVSGYYNPAALSFLEQRVASTSYAMLSLDRSLNTLYYAMAIERTVDSNVIVPKKFPSAGIAFGIINAGVRNIDGRDNDGFHTENYSTSENQFALSFALRTSEKLSFGISTKIYYYSLFEKINTTSLGLDFGILYQASQQFIIGITFKDFLAKYKWDTSTLYGQQGNSTTEKFPLLRTIGLTYILPSSFGIVSAEFENSNVATSIVRAGTEIHVIDALSLRAGIDHWNLKNHKQAAPTFGLTVRTSTFGWQQALHYAYVVEPYGLFAMHTLSLSASFE